MPIARGVYALVDKRARIQPEDISRFLLIAAMVWPQRGSARVMQYSSSFSSRLLAAYWFGVAE